jgi:hypothetical protein
MSCAGESFGTKGMMIRQPEELATTLKRELDMAGSVVVVPVEYRDNYRLMEIVHPSALNGGTRRSSTRERRSAWLLTEVDGTDACNASFTSAKWAFVGSQSMRLALSKPAWWIWAKTLSGSQHSLAGQMKERKRFDLLTVWIRE